MAWMGWVFDELTGFPHTSADIDILAGGKLTFDNVPGCSDNYLQCSVIKSNAVAVPGGAASQDPQTPQCRCRKTSVCWGLH